MGWAKLKHKKTKQEALKLPAIFEFILLYSTSEAVARSAANCAYYLHSCGAQRHQFLYTTSEAVALGRGANKNAALGLWGSKKRKASKRELEKTYL